MSKLNSVNINLAHSAKFLRYALKSEYSNLQHATPSEEAYTLACGIREALNNLRANNPSAKRGYYTLSLDDLSVIMVCLMQASGPITIEMLQHVDQWYKPEFKQKLLVILKEDEATVHTWNLMEQAGVRSKHISALVARIVNQNQNLKNFIKKHYPNNY